MREDVAEITTVENVELEDIKAPLTVAGAGTLGRDKYLEVVKDVEIRLTALLGSAELTVGELFAMSEGGVVKLDKDSAEPIELKLNGQLVARGNLVVVDDNFGVQLTEVCEF